MPMSIDDWIPLIVLSAGLVYRHSRSRCDCSVPAGRCLVSTFVELWVVGLAPWDLPKRCRERERGISS
eukprot:6208689-Amphidinium_carterae.2